ncbi:tubulin folding cofactor B (macronuclear) [Tetrahymena thermophila SB210]|uniref:Tubulin folding cofactor B n=1 Tax=Tetrahymena thermophila (strain SB210) TaxID=312017 RepID=I7LZP3_TETTS|nr:tubulin folding cofactor B [Tetrahymena thermophila SB210]EAR84463.1 tubulin folding cofactor B [Tetrahymena thermophila SB210]|eukprot:XP_001032126.1 tubulin folding cofactor B [Tetrahymena thermophila SB210]
MHSVQALPGQTPSVILHLTHNLTINRIPEIRFDLSITIKQLKEQIEKRYGSSSDQMELILQDTNGNNVSNLSDDTKQLGFYYPQDNYIIHVIDNNPNSILKDIDDVSKVNKYTMSEEDYDKLQDNFRKFKKQLLENNPELAAKQNNPVIITEEDYLKEEAEQMKKGDRCQLKEKKHRGTVEYVGKIPNLGQGYYIGIKLDEPYGKHNGSVGPVQYFECPDKYGIFVRPDKVEVGDFPEYDLDDLVEDDEV